MVDEADRGGSGVAGAVVAGSFDAVGVVAGRMAAINTHWRLGDPGQCGRAGSLGSRPACPPSFRLAVLMHSLFPARWEPRPLLTARLAGGRASRLPLVVRLQINGKDLAEAIIHDIQGASYRHDSRNSGQRVFLKPTTPGEQIRPVLTPPIDQPRASPVRLARGCFCASGCYGMVTVKASPAGSRLDGTSRLTPEAVPVLVAVIFPCGNVVIVPKTTLQQTLVPSLT